MAEAGLVKIRPGPPPSGFNRRGQPPTSADSAHARSNRPGGVGIHAQAGPMSSLPFEMVNAVFPPIAAPVGPLTPPDGPLMTVIWPPGRKRPLADERQVHRVARRGVGDGETRDRLDDPPGLLLDALGRVAVELVIGRAVRTRRIERGAEVEGESEQPGFAGRFALLVQLPPKESLLADDWPGPDLGGQANPRRRFPSALVSSRRRQIV